MSRADVEIVRRLYDGWARGDFSEGEAFHPDVEFEMPDWPEGARARGLEEMRRVWFAALNAWDDFRAEPEDFIDAGDHVVVVFNRIHARGTGSGAAVRADTASVWELDGAKVVRLALYWDRGMALESAGLQDQPADTAGS